MLHNLQTANSRVSYITFIDFKLNYSSMKRNYVTFKGRYIVS